MVGEIHLARIAFTDGSAVKLRPVLLLKANSFQDAVFLPLTSNINTKGIVVDNTHLQDGYLPKISVVVYEKPGEIATFLLQKKIDTLNKNTHEQIIQALISFLET